MPRPKLTFKSVRVRSVVVPLRRPVVSKVGLFRDWPMILIDLYTNGSSGNRVGKLRAKDA